MDIDFASPFVRRDTNVARPRAVAAWLFACCALRDRSQPLEI